jgi:prepilin-type processing-associated H-X9-DG protein
MEYALPLPPGSWTQRTTSYRGSCGPFFNGIYNEQGVITDSPAMVTLASITDGTSNTIAFTENTDAWCVNGNYKYASWVPAFRPAWNVSSPVLLSGLTAPNPWKYLSPTVLGAYSLAGISASSLHPGGVNAAFADGSVHFIKDTISTWGALSTLGGPASSY